MRAFPPDCIALMSAMVGFKNICCPAWCAVSMVRYIGAFARAETRFIDSLHPSIVHIPCVGVYICSYPNKTFLPVRILCHLHKAIFDIFVCEGKFIRIIQYRFAEGAKRIANLRAKFCGNIDRRFEIQIDHRVCVCFPSGLRCLPFDTVRIRNKN